ncbi:MAG: hypothetical protein MJ094_05245 [Saccharofermentans sp.]|nr:hypothetical protein [Saccharofermentans sp.]
MNKTEFINRLVAEAGITNDQATAVNEIMENHSFIGKNSKRAVESEIAGALNIDDAEAVRISDIASGIIASAIKDKLKHPFGGRD